MHRKSNSINFVKLISYILIFVVVLGLFGALFKFTDGFNEDFKTFYVEYNGEKILSSERKLSLPANKELRFDCKYTFDVIDKGSEAKGFSVKIIPDVTTDNNFTFFVDGQGRSFSSEGDLSSAFNLKIYADYFTFSFPGIGSIQNILQARYSDKTVSVPDDVLPYDYYFSLVISNYNETVNYKIKFKGDYSFSITLDKEEIIF